MKKINKIMNLITLKHQLIFKLSNFTKLFN